MGSWGRSGCYGWFGVVKSVIEIILFYVLMFCCLGDCVEGVVFVCCEVWM